MPPDLHQVFDPALLGGRTPALVGGILLLGFGARLYRAAILVPGVLLGVWAGSQISALAHLGPAPGIVLTVGLAAIGAIACSLVEAAAVALAGAVMGAVATGPALGALAVAAPWWAPIVGALFGGLLFRYLFDAVLRPATALAGAMIVAWTMQRAGQPWVVGGLAVGGWIVQWLLARTGEASARPRPANANRASRR